DSKAVKESKQCKSALTESNDVRDKCRTALHQKEVSYDKDDLVNIFAPNCNETLILEQESRSKLEKDLVKPYDYTYQNRLYELFTPQTQKSLDQLSFNASCGKDKSKKANANEFVKDLKEEMFDNLQYVQSLEKELDELKSDKTEFSNEYDLLLQECLSKDILCAALSSMTDIDKYSKMA
ncbi:hypothetical protein Tco_1485950, partial [Tanacetum coccineum]